MTFGHRGMKLYRFIDMQSLNKRQLPRVKPRRRHFDLHWKALRFVRVVVLVAAAATWMSLSKLKKLMCFVVEPQH